MAAGLPEARRQQRLAVRRRRRLAPHLDLVDRLLVGRFQRGVQYFRHSGGQARQRRRRLLRADREPLRRRRTDLRCVPDGRLPDRRRQHGAVWQYRRTLRRDRGPVHRLRAPRRQPVGPGDIPRRLRGLPAQPEHEPGAERRDDPAARTVQVTGSAGAWRHFAVDRAQP